MTARSRYVSLAFRLLVFAAIAASPGSQYLAASDLSLSAIRTTSQLYASDQPPFNAETPLPSISTRTSSNMTTTTSTDTATETATSTPTPTAPASGATIRVPANYSTIQAAINAALDGDLVLVSPGVYNENLTISGKTITLASEFYDSGDPSDISSTIIDGSGGGAVIIVDDTVGPDTTIMGFTIRHASDGLRPFGILNILNNIVTDTIDGIDYEGGGGVVRNSTFENNSDDGIDLDGPSEALIEDNIIRNNGDDGIEIRLDAYSGPTLTTIIRNNTISGNGEDAIQLIDYPDLSNRVIIIERNLILNSGDVGIGLMDNGDTLEDFRAASIPERILVFNNTISGNPYALTGGDNLIALNNLFINSAVQGLKKVDGSSIAAFNLFWGNGINSTGSVVDSASSILADPLLDTNFDLQQLSPAVDAGTPKFVWNSETVLDLAPAEYLGVAPDLGWHESKPTFSDVPPDHWAWQFVELLVEAGLTAGYPDGTYRPDNPVTRAEMAVFLKKGIHGSSYLPPLPDGSHPFSDIAGHWAEEWIEDLYDEGFTSGFPDGTYRPENNVTRAEMAVFLKKGIHGSSYLPPLPDGSHPFSDIAGHWAEAWIEDLYDEGITTGYPDGTYRPENQVTRAEMAVFLVNAFSLPLP